MQASQRVPTPAARGPCRVEEVQGRSGFDGLRTEWDALLARGPVDEPFHRHAFVGAWLRAFAPEARLRVFIARDADGRAAGMAPLLEERRSGLALLSSPSNDHSPRVEWILGEDPDRAMRALWEHLRERIRWDVLLLRDVPRHGPTSSLLEALGWKGERGTAIARDPRTIAFYRGLARAAGDGGWLALRSLDLDGRPVAMHFGLLHRGVYSLPKPAYEERLGACSPGQLLVREVLAECEARQLRELDFLGPDMAWKRDWEPALRPHDWLYVYRPGMTGAVLHAVKHRLKPLAREMTAWWRR